MSFIPQSKNEAIQFCLLPMYAAYDLIKSYNSSVEEANLKAIPDFVASRINKFIKSIGLEPKNFTLKEGTTLYSVHNIIVIPSSLIKKIKKAKTLSDADKFAIAHEIGHIIHQDSQKSAIFNRNYYITSLRNYTMIMLLPKIFRSIENCFISSTENPPVSTPFFIFTVAMAHMVTYAKNKIAFNKSAQMNRNHLKEFKADRYALQLLGKKGALEFFQEDRKVQLEFRKELIKDFPEFNPSFDVAFVTDGEITNLIDKDGGIKDSIFHPDTAEREYQINHWDPKKTDDKKDK